MTKVIGIDHGYGYIKTANHEFRVGIEEFKTEPPIIQRVVKYDGKYYSVGGTRQNVKREKWQDESYWIMTLAAVAEELGDVRYAEVILAVGLPLTRFGAEKDEFKKYIHRAGVISFEYQGSEYQITIKDVMVYPQGYSAVADKLDTFEGATVICDVGSWTVDILPLYDGTPDMGRITSLNLGVIKSLNSINEELRREFGNDVDEATIQQMMMGKDVKLPSKYKESIKAGLKRYADEVLSKLGELGFNTETTPFVFSGGGAMLIKLYGNYDAEMTDFLVDIHANAKGFEEITKNVVGGV